MSWLGKIHPFHLSKTAVAVMVVLGLYVGAQAALYRVSEPEIIQQKLNVFLQNTHRTVSFNPVIERRLFPRPTVIIKDLQLSEADGKTQFLRIEQVRVGFAWLSLFGTPAIEKLVVNQPDVQLVRYENGYWNIADLWKKNTQGNVKFNRVQINNGRAIVQDTDTGSLELKAVNVQISNRDNGQLPYSVTAQLHSEFWDNMSFKANGVAKIASGSLQLPDADVRFVGKENGYDFSGSLKTSVAWQGEEFLANETHLLAQSKREGGGTFNAHITKLNSRHGNTQAWGISAMLATKWAQRELTGTLNVADASWKNQAFISDNLTLNIASRPDNWAFLIKSDVRYLPQTGIRLSSFKLNTRQGIDSIQSRFVSEWEGNLNATAYDDWQLSLQGLFDRQPAAMVFNRGKNHISGSLKLARLNVAPYFENNKDLSIQYPKWFNNLSIDAGVQIGTMLLPEVQIDNLKTQLHADAQKMQFSPLSADLYSGHSEGELTVFNQSPLRYHLKQNAKNVQIRPLLQDVFGESDVSGRGDAVLDLSAQYIPIDERWQDINGSVQLTIIDGQWLGLNFAKMGDILSGKSNINLRSERQNYPFKQFSVDAKIDSSVSKHKVTAELIEPAAQMHSEGTVDFVQKNISENMILSTRNGQSELPLKISGSLKQPNVSLDFQRITAGLDSPEAKQKAISQTLKQQWDWLLKKQTK